MTYFRMLVLTMLAVIAPLVCAQGNLDVSTPAIVAIQSAMQARHANLAPLYDSGAIGLTRDGKVALRDASSVPLPQRGALNGLLASENADRTSLYREIARANGHPEWEAQVQATFAQRWVDKARKGWWVQGPNGDWSRK
ncbi:MAG: YdbL family protein [Zoogloeaceae bacterium]|nr:YdbL family protein [Zoogloeaceae bacterium]MCW5616119.1 YdbL family protein [Rhodocyclaceae bacterium]